MIALWGPRNDAPLEAVRVALTRRGVETLVIDQHEIAATEVRLDFDGAPAGELTYLGRSYRLEAIDALYLRTHDSRRLAEIESAGRDSAPWHHAVAVEDALLSWCEAGDTHVVNRPSGAASNASKPYQASVLRSCGFEVPKTLVTTDPDAARRFWTDHGAVIYKSLSGIRSIVRRLTTGSDARLADVRHCPTQFQQFVPGWDVRVHKVGERLFATEIDSDHDDYRYPARDGTPPTLRPCELPKDVAEKCRAAGRELELPVAGIDLRRTPDGRWFAFEVNPSPGFTYFEAQTGQPIAQAIADYLIKAARDRNRRR